MSLPCADFPPKDGFEGDLNEIETYAFDDGGGV
jgi:hypothetical protein